MKYNNITEVKSIISNTGRGWYESVSFYERNILDLISSLNDEDAWKIYKALAHIVDSPLERSELYRV